MVKKKTPSDDGTKLGFFSNYGFLLFPISRHTTAERGPEISKIK